MEPEQIADLCGVSGNFPCGIQQIIRDVNLLHANSGGTGKLAFRQSHLIGKLLKVFGLIIFDCCSFSFFLGLAMTDHSFLFKM